MCIIIVSDIFGRTPELDKLCHAIIQDSESLKTKQVKHMFCFYSSQIRHFQRINPSCKVDFVMPAFEPDFSIEELSEQLLSKDNVTIHNTLYLHGFMNKRSKNFSHSGYNKYVDWLREKIS